MDYGNWQKIIYELIARTVENVRTGCQFRQLNDEFFMRHHVIILTEHNSTPQICTTIIYTQLAKFTFAKGFRKCKVSLYFRVSNRRDYPFINYSVFCHPPQPYSALLLNQFWKILPASPFIPDSPFINLFAQSTAVA